MPLPLLPPPQPPQPLPRLSPRRSPHRICSQEQRDSDGPSQRWLASCHRAPVGNEICGLTMVCFYSKFTTFYVDLLFIEETSRIFWNWGYKDGPKVACVLVLGILSRHWHFSEASCFCAFKVRVDFQQSQHFTVACSSSAWKHSWPKFLWVFRDGICDRFVEGLKGFPLFLFGKLKESVWTWR